MCRCHLLSYCHMECKPTRLISNGSGNEKQPNDLHPRAKRDWCYWAFWSTNWKRAEHHFFAYFVSVTFFKLRWVCTAVAKKCTKQINEYHKYSSPFLVHIAQKWFIKKTDRIIRILLSSWTDFSNICARILGVIVGNYNPPQWHSRKHI